ncbi:uncharacterized protein E0L32_009247 [Thyridium curvatum]|uniref:Uncharacterized protein n=1 Tax=Thyridium curvatum TaxID=1093900 RepID=A0A507ASK1_9PEZI|nr:uncharacterized protein E0L32_009247 [Thyridium curvatum]TPX09504.1 hypothetical protein E0L32_009247 [Thyridium curvatum]
MATEPTNAGDLPSELKLQVLKLARARTETRDIIDVELVIHDRPDLDGGTELVMEMHLRNGFESTERLREKAAHLAVCKAARREALKEGSTPLKVHGGVIYIDPKTAVLRFGPTERILDLLLRPVLHDHDWEPPEPEHIWNIKKICFDIDDFGLFHVPRTKVLNNIYQSSCYVREKLRVQQLFYSIAIICRYFPDLESVCFSTEHPLLGWFPDQQHFPSKTRRGIHINESGDPWSPLYKPKETVLTFWKSCVFLLSAFDDMLPVPVAPVNVSVRFLAWTPQHDRREEIWLPGLRKARPNVRFAIRQFRDWMVTDQPF